MIRCRPVALTLGMACSLAVVACPSEQHGGARAYPETHSGDSTPSAIAQPSDSSIQPGQLRTVSTAPVMNWAGPGGRPFEVQIRTDDPSSANARRFGTITLRNSARVRSPDLGQYPCTSCHLGRRMVFN